MRDAASPAIAGGLCAALAGWLTVVLGLLRKPVLVGIKSYLLLPELVALALWLTAWS